MNRYGEDSPYVFRPPKYSALWAPLICRLSDVFWLRRKHRVTNVIAGPGVEEAAWRFRAGDSLILAPNHADHADAHVLMNLAGRYGLPLHFMAAREIFLVNHGFNGFFLQRAGVFSVDREGSDLRSIKQAMTIVTEGKYPLVLFPEGEIFHLNAHLTPLNEGVAVIALRTAANLRKKGEQRPVAIVPTAIRYTYTGDVAATFPERMARLERKIHWEPRADADIVDRIYRFGEALLSLKEKEYGYEPSRGTLAERLDALREALISRAEEEHLGGIGDGPHPERVRRIRGKIRTLLLADPPPDAAVRTSLHRCLDRVYDAVRMYSYPGQYIRERNDTDRIAETILKFEEDILGEYRIPCDRTAHVTCCKPVDMADFAEPYAQDAKATAADVTNRIADAIRAVLEAPAT